MTWPSRCHGISCRGVPADSAAEPRIRPGSAAAIMPPTARPIRQKPHSDSSRYTSNDWEKFPTSLILPAVLSDRRPELRLRRPLRGPLSQRPCLRRSQPRSSRRHSNRATAANRTGVTRILSRRAARKSSVSLPGSQSVYRAVSRSVDITSITGGQNTLCFASG